VRVGLVSDTHDDLGAVAAAVDRFDREGVGATIHCGDVVAPFAATPFADCPAFHAVRGNNDGEWNLAGTVEEFGTHHGELAELTLDGHAVAVYHGTSGGIVDALVDCGAYDYVFSGHTHAREHEERDGTVHVNPGGPPIPVAGADDAFHVAVVDLDDGRVRHDEVGRER